MPGDIALVTGATEGIGRATAWALARAGYPVAVTARTAPRVEALVGELVAAGFRATGLAADVGDPAAVTRLVDHVAGTLGPITVLVNNAGILIPRPFLDTTLDDWSRTFATNVLGVATVTRAVLPAMIDQGRGDIVNIASLAGKNGVPGAAAYSASKHAVLGLSRSLMLELRPHGIRVIAICPGSVDTPMMREQRHFTPNFERILRPDDVAAAVVHALCLPPRATVSELDLRPSCP